MRHWLCGSRTPVTLEVLYRSVVGSEFGVFPTLSCSRMRLSTDLLVDRHACRVLFCDQPLQPLGLYVLDFFPRQIVIVTFVCVIVCSVHS